MGTKIFFKYIDINCELNGNMRIIINIVMSTAHTRFNLSNPQIFLMQGPNTIITQTHRYLSFSQCHLIHS